MSIHFRSKRLFLGLLLVMTGWLMCAVGMMQIVTHPLQPSSLVLLVLETACALISLRLTDSEQQGRRGIAERFSSMLSVMLFGTALLPFWVGLAFLHPH